MRSEYRVELIFKNNFASTHTHTRDVFYLTKIALMFAWFAAAKGLKNAKCYLGSVGRRLLFAKIPIAPAHFLETNLTRYANGPNLVKNKCNYIKLTGEYLPTPTPSLFYLLQFDLILKNRSAPKERERVELCTRSNTQKLAECQTTVTLGSLYPVIYRWIAGNNLNCR